MLGCSNVDWDKMKADIVADFAGLGKDEIDARFGHADCVVVITCVNSDAMKSVIGLLRTLPKYFLPASSAGTYVPLQNALFTAFFTEQGGRLSFLQKDFTEDDCLTMFDKFRNAGFVFLEKHCAVLNQLLEKYRLRSMKPFSS